MYLREEHDEVIKELRKTLLLRRLSEGIEDRIDDDVSIWQSWISQHEQLCHLLRSQEQQVLQLRRRKRRDSSDLINT